MQDGAPRGSVPNFGKPGTAVPSPSPDKSGTGTGAGVRALAGEGGPIHPLSYSYPRGVQTERLLREQNTTLVRVLRVKDILPTNPRENSRFKIRMLCAKYDSLQRMLVRVASQPSVGGVQNLT